MSTINQTFTIPAGTYTAGYWAINLTNPPGPWTITTDSGLHSVGGTTGLTSFSFPISVQQLADVNAAAGSNLPAVFTSTGPTALTGAGWILHLTATGLVMQGASFPWTDTGINVPPGEGVTITASGWPIIELTAGLGSGYYTYPEGYYMGDTTGTHPDVPANTVGPLPSAANFPCALCNPGSLVFATGATMPAQTGVSGYQGNRVTVLTAGQVGGQHLWACYNDDTTELYPTGYYDNVGAYTMVAAFNSGFNTVINTPFILPPFAYKNWR